MSITTKTLAIHALSVHEIRSYERVKRFYMRLGEELERGFAAAVDGTHNPTGQADVTTRLGDFEFCAGHNTKNHAGSEADAARGQRVQACGQARKGYLSGEAFLTMHGVDGAMADTIRLAAARRAAAQIPDQLRLT